jgi:hypothetical protein
VIRNRHARSQAVALPLGLIAPLQREVEPAAPMSWPAAVRASAVLLAQRPGLLAVGLAGFLARGGLLLFALPFVVLPTVVGVGNWIGPTSITAGGPSDRLLWLIGAFVGVGIAGLALGTVAGAFADLHLFRAADAVDAALRGRPARDPRGATALLARLVLIRLLAIVPVSVALAWAANRFGAAAYRELILPDELVTPIVLRVLDRTRDVVAIVIGAWLLGELLGGLAVRHHLRRGDPVPVALLRPIVDLIRRPVTTVVTFALGAVLPLLALAPVLALAWALFGGVRFTLAGGDPVRTLAATILFIAVWCAGLGAAAYVASWRSLLASFEVLRAGRSSAPVAISAPARHRELPAEA